MEGLLFLVLVMLGIAIVDAAASRWGVDSRDRSSDTRTQGHMTPLR